MMSLWGDDVILPQRDCANSVGRLIKFSVNLMKTLMVFGEIKVVDCKGFIYSSQMLSPLLLRRTHLTPVVSPLTYRWLFGI